MKNLFPYHRALAICTACRVVAQTVILPVLMGCVLGSHLHAEPTNTTVVGVWATEPSPSQLGMVINHYQFETNGSFKCWVDFLSATSLPRRVVSGQYRVDAGKITMVTKWKTNEAEFASGQDVLVLNEGPGKTFRLKRAISRESDSSEKEKD